MFITFVQFFFFTVRLGTWQLQSHDPRNNSTCIGVCSSLDPGSDSSKSPVLYKPSKSGRATFFLVTFMCPQAPLPLSVSVGRQLVFKKHQHVEQSSPFSLLLTSGVVRYSTEVFG